MKIALTTFNWVAILVATFTILATGAKDLSPNLPPWGFLVFLPFACFFFACLALPFIYLPRVLRGNDNDNFTRIFLVVINIIFCIVAGFEVVDVMEGRNSDFMEIYCMGFAPLALLNALYLMFSKQSAPAN
ncbi:hypothetical protein [Roseateles sp. LYH14W]|uniref:DUF805 domain-containing protein n=1 Tax=Pelomonas parva TaxID=3299032 RepID=A0ABW7FAB9_9BURK